MRIFHNNTEVTKEIQKLDLNSYSLNYVAGDFIYIASDFPFNHLYFNLGASSNIIDAQMKIEYWGLAWNQTVELRDDTDGFNHSGFVEFTPNRQSTWTRENDSTNTIGTGKTVYYKYWTRLSFDVSLTAGLELQFIGNKFSDDYDLYSEYPIFDDTNFLNAFKVGKTSWEEQHLKAAELIIQDLQKKNILLDAGQILDRTRFNGASICKVAEILFTSFGTDYAEQKKAANIEYLRRLDLNQYTVDKNLNAIEEPTEKIASQGWLSR